MNCEQYQGKILEALAAGVAQLPYVVSAHREVCPVCREFYETQASLFRSIDSGLRAMVDQAVPPSLIPGVRARLDEQPVTRRMWIPGWSFAVVAAVAILVASFGHLRREPGRHPNPQPGISVASRSIANSVPAMQSPPKPVAASHTRTKKSATSAVPSPAPAEPVPEVIALAEERQAFAKFVAELPQEKEVALALTRPAPATPDVSVEIALLMIGNVEVKPLEVTQENGSAN